MLIHVFRFQLQYKIYDTQWMNYTVHLKLQCERIFHSVTTPATNVHGNGKSSESPCAFNWNVNCFFALFLEMRIDENNFLLHFLSILILSKCSVNKEKIPPVSMLVQDIACVHLIRFNLSIYFRSKKSHLNQQTSKMQDVHLKNHIWTLQELHFCSASLINYHTNDNKHGELVQAFAIISVSGERLDQYTVAKNEKYP